MRLLQDNLNLKFQRWSPSQSAWLDKPNFKRFLNDPLSILKDTLFKTLVRKKKPKATKQTCSYPLLIAVHLTQHLISSFDSFYIQTMGPFIEYAASVYFRPVQAQAIMNNINLIAADKTMNTKLIGRVIGGQMLRGQVNYLAQSILDWFGGKFYQSFVQDREAHLLFVEREAAQL
ncbi:hypothetical protein MJO28_016255 [Puccinia striiformis f. sp. tritici]|uniref:Uncharacterized protein n=1 Tax=Puccinia striiformis f. sp. tritici TaxID=168172 RepID=A0ACC0DNT8_9BASI|nr:hypothetical protein MJO28_016255 [Puccinia striiformis f. sp. tritici]